jgi:hypothetical protein
LGDTPLAAALSPAMVTAYDTEKRRPLMFKSEKAKREPEWNLPMCAYAEALKRIARKDLSMVSLGIGAPTRPLPYEEVREWGLVHWARPLSISPSTEPTTRSTTRSSTCCGRTPTIASGPTLVTSTCASTT